MMAYFGAGTKCRSPPDIMGGAALRLAAADKVIDLLASCGRSVGWHLAARRVGHGSPQAALAALATADAAGNRRAQSFGALPARP